MSAKVSSMMTRTWTSEGLRFDFIWSLCAQLDANREDLRATAN